MKWFWSFMIILAGCLVWGLLLRFQESDKPAAKITRDQVVAVETADITTGPLALHRTFSGALESAQKFIVAPKVSGRVEHLSVDIGDTVKRGQVVVRLDNAAYIQAVTQAEKPIWPWPGQTGPEPGVHWRLPTGN